MKTTLTHSPWLTAAVAVMLLGLVFGMGSYPLLDPDEGRNAEVAREIAETNDYVVPRLNGLPYADKPILYFAAGAAVMEILGPTEFAARLPSMLFTLATLALVGWFGRRLLGPAGGLIAVAATGTMPLTLAFARTVIFDSTLTFFVTLSVVGFYLAAEEPRASRRDADKGRAAWWITMAWAGLALGVLTKGPVALGLPLMIMVPYLGWRRRLDALWDGVATLSFIAILLPWLLAMSRAVPGFLHYAVVTETALRFATDELHRTAPLWYFIPILLAGSLPWSLAVFGAWKRGAPERDAAGKRDRRLVLLLLWIVVPLVFFTMSQSKRPHYVLPLMPAIGLLLALFWTKETIRAPGARATGIGLGVCGAVLLAAPWIVGALLDVDDAVTQAIPGTAVALGGACIISGLITFFTGARRDIAVLALCLPVASIPAVSLRLMDAIGSDRSTRDLAAAVQPMLTGESGIVAIESYPLSLPFYLGRTMLLSTTDASELTSNYLEATYSHWAEAPDPQLRPVDWWFDALATCTRPLVFVVRSDDARVRAQLAAIVPLIAETRKAAAYGPCGVTDLATPGPDGQNPSAD
jgi:4-amino-4-deoxy-L-arabinose transferase-like glycosyltransferase